MEQEILQLYESVPLPFRYCRIPSNDEPDIVRKSKRYYYINQVITNITRTAFKHAGFIPTSKKNKWNVAWGRQFDSSQYGSFQCWQKVNHFSGAYLIGRKDQLHKRMKELRKRSTKHFSSFYPKSFLLPEDSMALQKSWKKKMLWIVKPVASSRGRGIHVVSSMESKPPTKGGIIVQHYISKPFLITGRKFDLRLYVFVTSVTPLRIYLHRSGLARFATHEYDTNAPNDRHMHLTNFSINKKDDNFVKCANQAEESIMNSKWSLDFFLHYLDSNGVDSQKLMTELERVTCATIIAGMSEVRSFHCRHVVHRHTSFELYGIDIILDENLQPHVMEINISPSLNATDSSLDFRLKYPMMLDVLNLARIIDCNAKKDCPCPGMALIDKECRESLKNGRISDIERRYQQPNNSRSALSSLDIVHTPKVRKIESNIETDILIPSDFKSEKKIRTSPSRPKTSLSRLPTLHPLKSISKPTPASPKQDSLLDGNLNNNPFITDAWNSPVFADYVMIRDFLEEKQRMGGFRRIYPKRKTIDEYTCCFSNLRYHDIVFGSWIKMNNQERLHAIQKNWSVYQATMNQIRKKVSSQI